MTVTMEVSSLLFWILAGGHATLLTLALAAQLVVLWRSPTSSSVGLVAEHVLKLVKANNLDRARKLCASGDATDWHMDALDRLLDTGTVNPTAEIAAWRAERGMDGPAYQIAIPSLVAVIVWLLVWGQWASGPAQLSMAFTVVVLLLLNRLVTGLQGVVTRAAEDKTAASMVRIAAAIEARRAGLRVAK